MFQQRSKSTSNIVAAITLLELVYHGVVRSVRKGHGNAVMSILMNLLQAATMVLAFVVMFQLLGLRRTAIRGDFLLYIMSGIFLYITHTKTVGAVAGAEGPASPMMQHAPMNTIVAILSTAIGALYIQVLSLFAILLIYYNISPFEIKGPVGAVGMLILAWFTGAAVGMIFLAMKPWNPTLVGLLSTIYQRANMIASGKMFVANTLPASMLLMFNWNPLFHVIDQARGYAFINYEPHYSSAIYALNVGLVLMMIGLMGEFYTRRHASASWGARH